MVFLPSSTVIYYLLEYEKFRFKRVDNVLEILIAGIFISFTLNVLFETRKYKYKWIEFLQQIKCLDGKLHFSQKNFKNIFLVEFIIVQLYRLIMFTCEFGEWTEIDIKTLFYSFFMNLNLELLQLFCHLVGIFAKLLEERLVVLNYNLKIATFTSNRVMEYSFGKRLNKKEFSKRSFNNLKNLSQSFGQFRIIIEYFNILFGRRIFLMIALILVSILQCANFALFRNNEENYFGNIQSKIHCVMSFLMWMVSFEIGFIGISFVYFFFQCMYVYIFWRCNSLNKEIKSVAPLCTKLQRIFREDSDDYFLVKWLRDDYDGCNLTQLTAADVFVLDICSFFSLLSSLASWLIICFQVVDVENN